MTTNEQPCGFGEFLITSRQVKGLSLEQVSEQTKIPVSKLKELENEDLDKLPAAVFVRDLLKPMPPPSMSTLRKQFNYLKNASMIVCNQVRLFPLNRLRRRQTYGQN